MLRSMPFMPPAESLDIIFSICWNCFSRRLTSAGVVPEPRAMRARREPFSSARYWRGSSGSFRQASPASRTATLTVLQEAWARIASAFFADATA